MPNFDYVYYDNLGKRKKGTIEAISAEKVTQLIKADGFIPISVAEQSVLSKDINLSIGSPVKIRDLCIFCRQFESIMKAGVSLSEALELLGNDTQNKVMAGAIKSVHSGVQKGQSLAEAMRDQEKVFPPMLINMVESGEASGSLDTAFTRMADQFEKEAKLKDTIKKAMMYPIVVLVVAIIVVIVMMVSIVPTFASMLEEANAELPAITKFVMGVSDFFQNNLVIIVFGILLLIIGFLTYRSTDNGKHVLSSIALKLPLFGMLITKSASARMTRILSTLMSAGVPLIEAVEISAKVIENAIIQDTLMEAKNDIARGIPLSESLTKSGVFPPMVCNMIKIGEETGNMESMLDRIADYYDDEVDIATSNLTTMLEPLIIVILAVIVGTIMLAVLMPMMSLYGAVEGM